MAITKKPEAKPGQGTAAEAFIEGAPDSSLRPGVTRGQRRQITLTIAPELLAKVDALAKQMGQSRAAFINLAIYRAVQGEEGAGAS
ncbi:MAG: ribbon-helix-helix domain-containing protein [Acidobacteria bacterium]|nr:ribbon-helix-helix domain-containing protein [Acidobacteriota bacterium]